LEIIKELKGQKLDQVTAVEVRHDVEEVGIGLREDALVEARVMLGHDGLKDFDALDVF